MSNSRLLTKFETRSHRVKGLAFHPRRPWILASLHSGSIQLWDYRTGSLIDKFEEHEMGPVRGVDFHNTQPLFVSGGDDYKVKVWNYKLRRCIFTLVGHLDYVRTVQFHKEQPWIVSASDDQTLRIWNWQSRSCISLLTGHNHYVMSAQFHPKEDLLVSSSLDQCIRVWDISGLKRQRIGGNDILNVNINQELFGGTDVQVKHILEGHEKGVNWAAFHPTHPLIVSAADDRSIRIWKMDDLRGFEIEQLRGHSNNVSCAVYYKDYIISNSEDRTIRVWDAKQRNIIHTFRRDNDRFWILVVHPEKNLIAAGHDNGLVVFKLERERPAHCIQGSTLYYVKERVLKSYDFESGKEDSLIQLRKNIYPPLSMSYCTQDKAAVFFYDTDGGSYELYSLPKSGTTPEDVKKGFYSSAVLYMRGKFVCLDKTRQLVVRNTKNDILKVITSVGHVEALLAGPSSTVLLKFDERVGLYDMSQKKIVGECPASKVKYAVWASDFSKVALLSKHGIVVANRKMKVLCTIHETARVKSAAFDESGVLIYSTLNHLKYCLSSGDKGIIKTLENPAYIVRVQGTTVFYLDREGEVGKMEINATEYNFKYALTQKNFGEVQRILKKTSIHGQALVSYLQQRGFPQIAMLYVKDDRVRFNLAIECGNLQVAEETAKKLRDPECWRVLGGVAMKRGNVTLAEFAHINAGDLEKLALLYVYTANKEKLRSLLSDKRLDTSTKFSISLYLNDIDLRIRVLEEAGQYALANYMREAAAKENPPTLPVLEMNYNPDINYTIEASSESYAMPTFDAIENNDEEEEAGAWPVSNLDDELDGDGDAAVPTQTPMSGGDETGEGNWVDDLLFEDEEQATPSAAAASGVSGVSLPIPGKSVTRQWTDNSSLAVDQIAAGDFNSAKDTLSKVGVAHYEPLKSFFMGIWTGCTAVTPGISLSQPHIKYLHRATTETKGGKPLLLPAIGFSINVVKERVKLGSKATTDGKFSEAIEHYRYCLHACAFLPLTQDPQEKVDASEIIAQAREYVNGLNIENKRKDSTDTKRQLELAAYFTHCKLQSNHVNLTLNSAMIAAYKAKNFGHATSFSKRLLDGKPMEKTAQQARKVIQTGEQNGLSNAVEIDYDEKKRFVICGHDSSPIYKAQESVKCSYCSQPFHNKHTGIQCDVCRIGRVGN